MFEAMTLQSGTSGSTTTRARERLVLFDIDGTLVLARGVGRRALTGAFRRVFGIGTLPDVEGVREKSARQIIHDLMNALGLLDADSASMQPTLEKEYTRFLELELTDPRSLIVLPGVVNILERLGDCPGVTLGIATGNLATGAQLKLRAASLDRYFAIHASGSDASDRDSIVRIAIERWGGRVGGVGSRNGVTYVGDTVSDVLAGLKGGALVVAVETGGSQASDLIAAGAHSVIANLLDTEDVCRTILGAQ
jgi:phosphoglycolate phosphatase